MLWKPPLRRAPFVGPCWRDPVVESILPQKVSQAILWPCKKSISESRQRMSNQEPITAIYESGMLKPHQPLALREHQEVQILVLTAESPVVSPAERLSEVRTKLDTWRAAHPPAPMRDIPPLSPRQRARLDADFDELLSDLRRYSQGDTDEEIARAVDDAVEAVRKNDRRK